MTKERELPTRLLQRLAGYGAAAAGAAIISSPPAHASIVQVTVDEPFVNGSASLDIFNSQFQISGFWNSINCCQLGRISQSALVVATGEIAGTSSGRMAKLSGSAGPSDGFRRSAWLGFLKYRGIDSIRSETGPCLFGCSGAVRIEFTEADGTHYGWISFSVGAPPCAYGGQDAFCYYPGEIFSYGYSTVPGQAVNPGVPEPPTLGLLALGYLGLGLWRKRALQTPDNGSHPST